jgi:hypothetical protein
MLDRDNISLTREEKISFLPGNWLVCGTLIPTH